MKALKERILRDGKCFEGGEWLRKEGVHVESLAIIESLDNCEIKFKE